MAAKNTSKSRGDTKNIKIKDSSEIPAVVAHSRAAKKSALMEDHESLCYEKGLQLSDEHLNEVKNETGVLNKVDAVLGNKSPTSSVKILKTTKTSASPAVKKEISIEEESLFKVPAYAPTPIKPARAMEVQAGEVNSSNTTGGNQASSDENKKECNNVIRLASKNLSDEERRKLRAKRFNIIVVDSNQNAEKDIAKNVSTPVYKSTSGSANHPTPTYDTLKKRAERFGENVSTVMKSLDNKEKMLKRKLKFLESVTNLKELEIKKQRAERFRMV
ncbi:hypothetical protein AVEN_79289-1 [Araneus ventricosus]|uniref:Uncharacterized protein n=1 Tax=Araneus ventricosus TaxID=182803 RepID=A0A4Y2N9S7_ARAVE|nr:hypothetical protein AVEN_79289-1 [Araneus ventricosus]